MQEDLEYRGETQPRKQTTAALLSLVSPGLGYMYVGQLLKGVVVNLLFLLMLETFVIVYSVLKFFPVLPAGILAVAWMVFSTFAAADVTKSIKRIQPSKQEYVLKGYNHWMMYTLVALLTFVAPIGVTASFISSQLLGLQTVETSGMFPSIQSGDTVLVDRAAFRARAPARGELVVVQNADKKSNTILRVVAVPNDIVRVEGEQIFVNQKALERAELQDAPKQPGELLAMIESNNGSRYVIAVSPKAYVATSTPPSTLGPNDFFVLADNRSHLALGEDESRVRDSRTFDAVSRSDIVGKPLYIAWSKSPDAIRTDRIGLRIR